MMGYILRVTDIKSQIPNFERNKSNGEIEIGCLLRVQKRYLNDEENEENSPPNILSGNTFSLDFFMKFL